MCQTLTPLMQGLTTPVLGQTGAADDHQGVLGKENLHIQKALGTGDEQPRLNIHKGAEKL